MTPQGGIATFTRVYYDLAKGFEVGDGWGRAVAGEQFRWGSWDPVTGLTVQSARYAFHIPAGDLRVTWRLPALP